MTDNVKAVERFVAAWHQPDAELRRRAIAELWSKDGVYSNVRAEFHGHEGIENAVTQAHEAYIAKGYEFKVAKVDSNHDAVRYTWWMVPAGGGEPASIGTHVAVFGPDGRILRDHQFIDVPPST